MSGEIHLEVENLEALVANALIAHRTSPTNALCVAKALVGAEIDGQSGHGLVRVSSYAAQAKAGKVDGFAKPLSKALAPGYLDIDAADGFAFPALDIAVDEVSVLAGAQGIAIAAIRRSHHAGQAGHWVELLAERGCLGLMFANSPAAMAPWGGNTPLYGTNPIAFAVPRRNAPPLLIDLSLSLVARGKVLAASKAGRPIPEGWALDAEGNPTTDAEAALKGTMLPMGGAKGAALALMVETFAAALTGAHFSYNATSFFDAEGDPPGVGQAILAIDINRTAGEGFYQRIDALATAIEAQDGARLPGTGRFAKRARAIAEGVPVAQAMIDDLEAMAEV